MQTKAFSLPASGRRSLNSAARIVIIRAVQLPTWGLARLLVLILGRRHIRLQLAQCDPAKRYVIVANHTRYLDPFMVIGSLPLELYRHLGPFRFFAYNALFDGWLRPLLLALGCFPAQPHPRYTSGLTAATTFLENRQTVLIFPEGKRVSTAPVSPRPGVATLAQLPNACLIPARIYWQPGWWPRFSIVIGRPVSAAGWSAEEILATVYQLDFSSSQPGTAIDEPGA